MALTSTDWMGSLGHYGTNLDKIDMSDVLSAVILKDTATLGQISMKGTVKNTDHYWIEDSLNSCVLYGSFSCGASCDNGYLMQRGHSSALVHTILRSGAILRQEGYPDHVFRAPMGVSSSTTISLVPYGSISAVGSVFDSTYSGISTRWFVVGMPYADESDASGDISKTRTRRHNITQVFERGIQIAETREHVDMYAVSDELKHQIKLRTYEIKRELNNAILNSYAYANAGVTSDVGVRTMAGIVQLLRNPALDGTQTNALVVNQAGAALTMTKINTLCSMIYDAGGFDQDGDHVLIVGPKQARVIALLEEQRIRKSSKELIVGSYANKVLTDLGQELPVVVDRWLPADQLLIIDKTRVKLMPLQGDAWHLEKMAKTGRTQNYQLSGQYTIELNNANECHGMMHFLAVS